MPAGFRHRHTVDAVFARMSVVAVRACRRVLTPSTFLRKRSMQCKKAADRRSPTQRGFALLSSVDRSIDPSVCFALLCFAALRPPPQRTVVSTLSGPVPQSVLERSRVCCMYATHSGRCTLHATSASLANRLCDGVLAHQECRAGPLRREARACRPCLQTIRCGMTAMHWWRTTWCSASQRSCGSTIPCAHLWAIVLDNAQPHAC
jgi:hypothetical protein